jgi:hypothetical protein
VDKNKSASGYRVVFMGYGDALADAVISLDHHGKEKLDRCRYPDHLKSRIVSVCTALRRLSVEVDHYDMNSVRDDFKELTEQEIDEWLARLEAPHEMSEPEWVKESDEVEEKMMQLAEVMEACREQQERLKRRRHLEGPGCDN